MPLIPSNLALNFKGMIADKGECESVAGCPTQYPSSSFVLP